MGIYTTPDNLYKPDPGESGWGALVNTNFDTIQAKISAAGATSIPGADPTGVVDSTAAIETWVQSLPAGSYVKLRPGDRYLITRGMTWTLNPGVTIEAYGVKLFQSPASWNGSMVGLTGPNIALKGIELYGWTTKTINTSAFTVYSGTGAVGVYATANAGGAPDVSGPSHNPDFFARDVNGNFTEKWPLVASTNIAPSVGPTDVILVASQCAYDVAPPLVAPVVTDSGIANSNGPEVNANYWYGWTKIMNDLRETGMGPISYYRSPSSVHFALVTGMPAHEGTPLAGVAGFALYRAKTDPTVLANWKQVLTCSAATTTTYDTVKTVDLNDVQPRGTTIFGPGSLLNSMGVTTYTLTHQIQDEEQPIYTWCQRVTPNNGNTISLSGSVVSVGRVGYGGSSGFISSAVTYTAHSGIKINQNCIGLLLKDCKVEGFDYVGINNSTANFAINATMDGCMARANMEQNTAMGCSGYQWITKNCIFGESGSSCNDNEPESTSAAVSDVTVFNTIFRNWGKTAFGWHANSVKNHRTHFAGVIFKTFGNQEAINGGAETFTGNFQIIDTRYVDRPLGGGTALTLKASNADLDCVIDGMSQVSVSALTNGNLAGGSTVSQTTVNTATQVIGTPNVYTFPTSANQPVGFAVGDYANIPTNILSDTLDNPYAMTITGASWAANVATITTTPHTSPITANIPTGLAGDTVTVSVTQNNGSPHTNDFPDWTRTPKFWFYIGTEAFKCISKSGTGNKNWSCVRGEFGTTPAAHTIGDLVSMATSQLIGDQQVVRNVKSTNNTAGTDDVGYNIAAAITAIGASTVSYAQTVNPGTFNTSTGPTTLGAAAWNNTAYVVTAVSGTTPGSTVTAIPYVITGLVGNAEKPLPSPAIEGGTCNLANIVAPRPGSSAIKLRVRYVNVVSPENYLTLSCPSSRVELLTADGRTQTFVSDANGVTSQVGYIGTTVGSPAAGHFPYAAGAHATDPTNSKHWVCTVGGSPGTWKSSLAT